MIITIRYFVGPHQIVEIRKREQIKNLPSKNLVEHGYARIEALMEEDSVKQ
jgi:YidC/Oxa1 family membrane protein insertase